MNKRLNPYESPRARTEGSVINKVETSSGEMVNTKKAADFSKLLLWGNVGVFFILAMWIFKSSLDFHDGNRLEYELGSLLFIPRRAMLRIELLINGLFFMSGVLIIGPWIVISMKNAWVIQRSGNQPKVSPDGALLWYFVPIACMWKPLQAIIEINKHSLKEPKELTFWIGSWWFCWLSGIIIIPCFSFVEESLYKYDNVLNGLAILLVDDPYRFYRGLTYILCALAAFCLIKIISKITEAQMEVFDANLPSEQKAPLDESNRA